MNIRNAYGWLVYGVMFLWVWLRTRFFRTVWAVQTAKRDFPLYIRTIRLNPDFPRIDSAPCYESEYPYRQGTAMLFRVVGTRGLTVGVMDNHSDSSHRAVNSRLIKALKSADGTRQYWDTPERRQAAEAASERSGDNSWLDSIGILSTGDDVEGA